MDSSGLRYYRYSLSAQERNDVIQVYNEGAKSMQTDVKAAIDAFEKVIVLSDKVGETANDLKQKPCRFTGLYLRLPTTTERR